MNNREKRNPFWILFIAITALVIFICSNISIYKWANKIIQFI